MFEPIQILTAERDGEDGLLVAFSDGTSAGYVAEELLELRPCREPTGAGRADGKSIQLACTAEPSPHLPSISSPKSSRTRSLALLRARRPEAVIR
jgi:hypothetical protein